ncbi:RNA-directed DNA polymerase, eukaryota, Reverse transcriptase zinc-binding domain protein [Artemisia annua]|uniref:RNA-directed DNA polymerase, eukaryota, Reverse transcriptase zinc-binding domain protein n=1 Tax=Artemisia annua TaxID=35608 RepID=A0A2U1M8N2_ARTAN|nr:RNA-directed DNA polymerase, eukaryota, Reverse transcriptase zinc-binding domain protein [Artemisia annua]
MDKDTSVNANSNVGLHSKGSQIAVDKDSNAQGTKNKPGSINQESSLLANAPILRSILKKAVRNVPGKDKNTSMSSVSTKVSGFKDKNACDIPTCDANELHSVGQQGDVDEVPLVGGIAAKVKNLDGTIFGSDGKVLKQSRMVHFADQVEVLPTEQHKDVVAGNGMSSGVGKAGRGTPTQVAQAATNSQGLNSNSSQPLVDNVGSGNINGEGMSIIDKLEEASTSSDGGSHDRVEGSSVIDIAMREFKDCVEEIEVFDVNRSGLQFTWNQKPRGTDGKLKKIDRIMANLACTDGFVGAHAIFQPYRISDHSPAILTIPTSYKFTPRPFKFYNILVQNSQFKRTVKESWDMDVSGFHMYKVVSKLKALKKPLRKLLYNEGNIHDKVVKLRHELDTKVNVNKVDVDGLGARMARLNKNERAAATSEATKPRQPIKGILKKPNSDSNKNKQGATVSSGVTQHDNHVMAASGSNQHALESDPMMYSSRIEKVHTEEVETHPNVLDEGNGKGPAGENVSMQTKKATKNNAPHSTNVMAGNGSNLNATGSSGATTTGASRDSTLKPVSTPKEGFEDPVFGTYFHSHTKDASNVGMGFVPTFTTNSVDVNVEYPSLPTGDGVRVSTNAGRFVLKSTTPSSNESSQEQTAAKDATSGSNDMVQSVDVNLPPKSYVGATTGTQSAPNRGKSNFRDLKKSVGAVEANSNSNASEISQPSQPTPTVTPPNGTNSNNQPTTKVPSPKLAANVTTSNPFDSLAVVDDGDGNIVLGNEEDEVVNVFDESGNLFDQTGARTPALNVPDV